MQLPTIQPPYGQTSIVSPNDDEIMSEANMMADALYFDNEYVLDEENSPTGRCRSSQFSTLHQITMTH